jgi:hypothetical protein
MERFAAGTVISMTAIPGDETAGELYMSIGRK